MPPKKRISPDPLQHIATKRSCTHADDNKSSIHDIGTTEIQAASGDRGVAPAQPLVWATNRQSLCDALPYFKSHQGGVYTKNRLPQGILIARNGEVRDTVLMDKCVYSLLVPSGGGREMKEDGTWTRAGEYEPAYYEQWNVIRVNQLPVMVIMDCRHSDFVNIETSSIPHHSGVTPVYIVLGAFFVTEMWQEAVHTEEGNDYAIFKVMLQKVNSSKLPTNCKIVTHTTRTDGVQESFPQYRCEDCGNNSPAAFKDQYSICLTKECKRFFTANGVQLQRHTLVYSEDFLSWVKPFNGDRLKIPDTVPPPPSKATQGYGTELRCRTGMVCPNCHHCDSRVFFSYWKCVACGLIHMAEPDPYPLAGIASETREHTKKLSSSKPGLFKEDKTTIFMTEPQNWALLTGSSSNNPGSDAKAASNVKFKDEVLNTKGFVTKFSSKDERSTRTIYMIFDPNSSFIGSLVHERPSAALKEGPCGANELWHEIQEPGVTKDFKRNAARCPGSSVETLTRHFTQNFGAHYDFGVKVEDTSFDAAPDVILKSLVHLSHMGKQAVESTQKIFQEEGYKAVMGSTVMDPWEQPNEMLALAYMEKDTISYHDDGEEQLSGVISTLSLGSPASMKVRFKRTKEDRKKGIKGSKAYLVLDVQLQHGDVVTMCDTRLQAFTEHTIVPVGIRRFAMTSRVIKEDYYLDNKAAKKLKKLNITLDEMKKSAQIPARAASFVFEDTQLEIANSS